MLPIKGGLESDLGAKGQGCSECQINTFIVYLLEADEGLPRKERLYSQATSRGKKHRRQRHRHWEALQGPMLESLLNHCWVNVVESENRRAVYSLENSLRRDLI
jgi:hypothetical protein